MVPADLNGYQTDIPIVEESAPDFKVTVPIKMLHTNKVDIDYKPSEMTAEQ